MLTRTKSASRKLLSKKKPEKALLLAFKNQAGRNKGYISVRHRGGGAKKLYRVVDFGQEKLGLKGTVKALEYDPNRTAYLALIEYENDKKGYILASADLRENDQILCAETTEVKPSNRMKLKNIPAGTQVYNIEIQKDCGGV